MEIILTLVLYLVRILSNETCSLRFSSSSSVLYPFSAGLCLVTLTIFAEVYQFFSGFVLRLVSGTIFSLVPSSQITSSDILPLYETV